MNKLVKKCGVILMSGVLLTSSFGLNKNCAKAQDVGGITATASLTDGRNSETTKATLSIQNGPALDLTGEARIYYRFGTRGYYSTSGRGTLYATSYSRSVRTTHTPATVYMCYGYYKVTHNYTTWNPTKTIGSKVSGVVYNAN